MLVTQISIDAAGTNRFEYVVAKQGDNRSRVIQITLINNGKIYILDNLTIARAFIKKPDKTEVLIDCPISNNVIELKLKSNILACAGTANVEILLTNNSTGDILTSAEFDLKIVASDTSEAESSTDYASLKEGLMKLDSVATKKEVEVLKARMDTFVALPEGSTTGDAELQDIRVGSDGTVYDSAGEAVRQQVSQLSEEIGKQTGTGLSTEAIDKLEEVGNYLVYTTADGGSKWIELISILRNGSSSGNLSSISATYSGGDVAVGTALTNLTGITVTATYSDGSTATVTGYALSGEIAEGENTITVSYGGKTTTFTVTGVAESDGVAVAMTAPVQHVDMEYVGHYSDGGETKYSDARFPCSNGKTMLSEKVFESDTTLKITVTPTANTFQCYLFCSTLLDGERILYVDDTDDLFYYIKSSSEVFAYGWSTEKHEFEYTVKAGYKFGIISISTSEMDTDIITVEVV